MKRLVITSAFALTILSGPAAAWAAPEPAPVAAAATEAPTPDPQILPSSLPTSMPSPRVSISLDPNTAKVCDTTHTTVDEGIEKFTTELNKAGDLATGGDLQGAEQSVKQSGTILIDLAAKLRTDSGEATNPQLKEALDNVATELQNLGGSLTGLTSLQNFDTNRLESLANRVGELCGTN